MDLILDVITPKSNLIAQSNLPVFDFPMIEGSLSLDYGFERPVTGTLSFEAVQPFEIDRVRKAYNNVNTRVDFYNHACVIKAYSDVVQRIYSDGTIAIESYNVSVNLGSWWEYIASIPSKINSTRTLSSSLTLRVGITALSDVTGVPYIGPYFEFDIPQNADKDYATSLLAEVQKYSRVNKGYVSYSNPNGLELRLLTDNRVWYFDESDVLSNISVTTQEIPSFVDALLGQFDSDPKEQDRPLIETQTKYVIQPPVIFTSTEGEDASVPPRGGIITDTTSVADASGPRKTQKSVTTINGNPMEETVTTYGYVYTADQVALDDAPGKPIRGSTAGYWMVIENYTTQYIYESVSPSSINTRIVDNITGKLIQAYYLPGMTLQGYLAGAKFFIGSNTVGTKMHRFNAETSVQDMRNYRAALLEATRTNDTLNENYYEALISATQWKSIGFCSTTNLTLDYYSNYYNIFDQIPYTIQKVRPNDIYGVDNSGNIYGIGLSDSLETDSLGFVYLLIPDPNYTPKLFVLNQSSYSNSYQAISNPQNILLQNNYDTSSQDDRDYTIFQPPLSTGEESFSIMTRKITAIQPVGPQLVPLADESFYTEYTNTTRSGEANFGVSSTIISSKTVPGKPPSAQSYREQYIPLQDLVLYRPFYRLYATSDQLNKYTPPAQGFSYPTRYIENAIEAAETDLSIKHLLNAKRTVVSLAWFYPDLREGDIIDIYGTETSDISAQKLLNASWTINFKGILYDGNPVATCEGTDLTLGNYAERKITTRQEIVDNRGISSQIDIINSAAPSGKVPFNVSAGTRRG